MKLIFGYGHYAKMLKENLTVFSKNKISGFVIDDFYYDRLSSKDKLRKNIYSFSSLKKIKRKIDLFIGFTFENKRGPNPLIDLVKRCQERGYNFNGFNLSEHKIKIELGNGCQIFRNVYYDFNCKIGSFTQIRPCVNLSHDIIIEDYCYIASNVRIGGGAVIKKGSFIGNGAYIAPNSVINKFCLVGQNSEVVGEIKEKSIVITKNEKKIKQIFNPFRLI